MVSEPVHDLEALSVVVVTDGVQDVHATVATLSEAHLLGARFALVVRAYDAPLDAQCTFVRTLRDALTAQIPIVFAGPPKVARAAGADGVHLGRHVATVAEAREHFGPGAWVSVPAHTPSDIAAAEREGAYAAFVSPVLPSPGKGVPLGFSGLSCMLRSAEITRLRCFALGGLGQNDVGPCLGAGAHGVAVIRSVWSAPNPVEALVKFSEAAGAKR